MRNLAVLFIHLLATLARLLGPGGVRSIVGEAITGLRSRTRLEQYDVNQLQQCVGI